MLQAPIAHERRRGDDVLGGDDGGAGVDGRGCLAARVVPPALAKKTFHLWPFKGQLAAGLHLARLEPGRPPGAPDQLGARDAGVVVGEEGVVGLAEILQIIVVVAQRMAPGERASAGIRIFFTVDPGSGPSPPLTAAQGNLAPRRC